MRPPFLDSNILLRHLTKDDPAQGRACFAVIQALERGELTAWTSELVIAEVVFVLASKSLYNLDRARVRELVLPLIGLPGLRIPHKRMYDRVFELYATLPIDYVGAYHAALIELRGETDILSYDRHFDRVTGLHRHEPAEAPTPTSHPSEEP